MKNVIEYIIWFPFQSWIRNSIWNVLVNELKSVLWNVVKSINALYQLGHSDSSTLPYLKIPGSLNWPVAVCVFGCVCVCMYGVWLVGSTLCAPAPQLSVNDGQPGNPTQVLCVCCHGRWVSDGRTQSICLFFNPDSMSNLSVNGNPIHITVSRMPVRLFM